MNVEAIRAVIERKAAVHPELHAPLRWHALQRIVRREGIAMYITALPRPAMLASYLGGWGIFLSSSEPARRHTYFAAHELGHLWLHHDQGCERWETCFTMDTDWPDDPREDDAECFATLVLNGPDFGIPSADTHAPLREKLKHVRSRPVRIRPDPAPRAKVVPRAEPAKPKVQPAAASPAPRPWPSPEQLHLTACRNASRTYPMFQVGEIIPDWLDPHLCEICHADDGRKMAAYQVNAHIPHLGCSCDHGCRCRWEPEP